MKKITALAATTAAIAGLALAQPAEARDDSSGTDPVIATFERERFDMSQGWGTEETRPEIQACHIEVAGEADCFRSEAELNSFLGESRSSRSASCSSSLRLYDGLNKTGAVASFTARGQIISLSGYGFNNRTSSYRVGACSSTLYNGIGSSAYPGSTSAYASANSMLSGWNNTISSIRIS